MKEEEKIMKRIKNNNTVGRFAMVGFLAGIGFGTSFKNIPAMLLGIVMFLLMTSVNSSIKQDKIILEIKKLRD